MSAVAGVEDELVDEDRDERVGDEGGPGDEPSDEEVSVHRDDGSENVAHDGRFVTWLGTFWWLREVVLVMAMRDVCAGILGSWTYRLVALCGSGLVHEGPKLVSAGWGRGGLVCSEGHDAERVVSFLESRRKATMIKGCQRAALGKWWGCSSEGRYSFHARATS